MPEPDAKSAQEDRGAKRKEVFISALIGAFASVLVNQSSTFVKSDFATDPWKILWILVPFVVVVVVTWHVLKKSKDSKLNWRWFLLLGAYCGIFGLAANSELLVWERSPAHDSARISDMGRSWLAPVWLGDWRYFIARREAMPDGVNLLVVLLDDSTKMERVARRDRDERLIEIARIQGARGIALDFNYAGDSTREDESLCAEVEQARAEGIFVIAAPDLSSDVNAKVPRLNPLKGSLACFPAQEQGHAMGYADSDGTVRTIPLFWKGQHDSPAFSLRVATAIQGKLNKSLEPPSMESLRFVPPLTLPELEAGNLESLEAQTETLEGYFVIVGENAASDSFKTPYGDEEPGARVHAYAVHSLLSGSYLRRPGATWSVVMLFAACYALTLFATRGFDARRLAQVAGVITLLIVLLSVAATYFWNVWLDIVYAVVAVWVLLPILLASRRFIEAKQLQPAAAPAPPPAVEVAPSLDDG